MSVASFGFDWVNHIYSPPTLRKGKERSYIFLKVMNMINDDSCLGKAARNQKPKHKARIMELED